MNPNTNFSVVATFAILCCLYAPNDAKGQEAPKAIYEITDHSRGIVVTTESADWSVQVSRFTFTMIDNPSFSTLRINEAFTQRKTVEETIDSHLNTAKENKNAELLSDDANLTIGGEAAKGYSFVVLKSRKVFVHVWFQKNERLFKVEIQAEEKNFDEFIDACQIVFDKIKFLDTTQLTN